MPYVLVEDFKSGIDTRRTAVTSVPGSLYGLDSTGTAGLTNAHITRGGEIEKRNAFKEWATLPAGTYGLAAGGGRVYVFGSEASPSWTGQPANLNYYRMEHKFGQPPTAGAYAMAKVRSVCFYNGEPYAAIEFEDGKIFHYWGDHDNPAFSTTATTAPNRIIDIYDGRARVSTTITGGDDSATSGTGAFTGFTVYGGTALPGNNLTSLRVKLGKEADSEVVDIIGGPVAHTGDGITTSQAIAAAINSYTSTPNFTAYNTVNMGWNGTTVTMETKGAFANGYEMYWEGEGDFNINLNFGIADFSGGIDNAVADYKIDGQSIIGSPVLWSGNHTNTAKLLADEINSTETSPNFEAVANGPICTVIAEISGTAINNATATVTPTGNLTHTTAATITGGTSVSTAAQAGNFVFSNKYAVHALEESNWRFCVVNNPEDWTSNINASNATTDGAGFQVLSNHARNSEELMSIETYFENMALFAEDCIQIWYYDPDPDLLQLVQVLNNTGTIASKSVEKIGDSDVFYLSRSGIRSLKAKDSSNSAILGDIGNPIDEMVIEAIKEDPTEGRDACGILDPRTGRYYLALGEKVYVFSYFPSSSVSAWSVYEPGFTITDWAFDGEQVLCRSENKIYSLGGEKNDQYDNCKVTVQLPFLDAQAPATNKMWSGIDAVCSSTWTVKTAPDPTDIETNETAATLNKVTYGLGRVGLSTTSTHLALRLENEQTGPAKLGNLAVHYTLNEAG